MKRIISLFKMLIPSVLQILIVAGFLIIALIAYNMGAGSRSAGTAAPPTPSTAPSLSSHPVDADGDGMIYTCSMHPQIQQDEPGDCPICGMELVPLDVSETESSEAVDHSGHTAMSEPNVLGYACAMNCVPPLEEPGDCPICGMEMQEVLEDTHDGAEQEGDPARRLSMSPEARALASIQTSPVVRRIPRRSIRLVGELGVREDTLAHISAYVGGRIDNLSAKYEGDIVEQGDDLVLLYSPELLAVQQEFLQAKASLERLPEGALVTVRRSSESAVHAASERLRLSGLSPDQIKALAESGVAEDQVILQAPIGGTVITRHAEQGEYVTKGERILTIARLETLWGEMAAYESDLPWLRVGQPVTFRSQAIPGHEFTGEVAWIDPITNRRTRTTRVRLSVDNKKGMLRPGMYITGRVESTLGEEPKLVIPASAPLITGKRAIVYLQLPNNERPTYQGVEVVLGPRLEDGYVVEEGLEEGQMVVTNGAFQIDSALQIIAKPSMMNPKGGVAMTGHENHGGTSTATEEHDAHDAPMATIEPDLSMEDLLRGYLQIQQALAQDDVEHARHGWMELRGQSPKLEKLMPKANSLAGMEELRAAFQTLSIHVISQVQNEPNEVHQQLRLVHCPMAFEFTGADWIQTEDEVRNPYFGAEMLTCGTVKQEWSSHD